jgi:hypothetical protein
MNTKKGDITIARKRFLFRATSPGKISKATPEEMKQINDYQLELSNLIDVMDQYNS